MTMRPPRSILVSSFVDSTEQDGEALDMNDVKESLPNVSNYDTFLSSVATDPT